MDNHRFLGPAILRGQKTFFLLGDYQPPKLEFGRWEARIFGDLKNSGPDDPIRRFYQNNRLQVLKPHLGTEPRVLYAGMDKEVR